jgi:long-chain acyl-CoA synthetase
MARSETLAHLLPLASSQYGGKPALVCGARTITFCELNQLALRFARGLLTLGVRPGDRVTLYLHNCLEWIVSYYGVARVGAVLNPINCMLTGDEVHYIASDCGAKAIIAPGDKAALLLDLKKDTPLESVIVCGDSPPTGAVGFSELLEKSSASGDEDVAIKAESSDLASIMYTSGTTGHPKGAMLTHGNLALNALLTATMHVRTSNDVTVSALPLCHVYGSVVLNSTMASGGTLVVLERFEEAVALDAIRKHRATLFEGVPTMFMRILNAPELEGSDLSSLSRCTTGGQTMPISKMQAVEERFGCPLLEIWGMTELGGCGTTHSPYTPSRLGSIGLPLPGVECRVADPCDGSHTLSRGEVGELMVRGPIVMQGYYGNAASTCETIEKDGWMHTGDLAHMDRDGYLFVADRKKEVIISGGYKVYPAEVERVVALHPAVAMVAVGRQRDAIKGEVPKAYVVLKRGTAAEETSVINFCREHLAAYKVPRSIQFVEDLPKTSTGKILRRKLDTLD